MPVVDSSSLAPSSTLRADVTIIGAGPAGITVALGLLDTGLDIVVLESGSDTYTPEAQALAQGDVAEGQFVLGGNPVDLSAVRMRALGGSTGHWGGLCRPLDPLDLGPRAEIGRGGWPIGPDELDPWYELAQAMFDMGPYRYDAGEWYASFGQTPPLDGPTVTTALYRQSPPTRFGEKYRPDLEQADRCTVVLRATAVGLVATPDGGHVQRIEVATADGDQLSVESSVVVLATGGIDVPRLLLLSTGSDPAGLANSSGLVGVGFMEHPHLRLGRFLVPDEQSMSLFLRRLGLTHDVGDPHPAFPAFRLTDEVLREQGLPSAALTLEPADAAALEADEAPDGTGQGVRELLGAAGAPVVVTGIATLRSEQVALARNLVRLGSRRDAFGLPLPEVRWSVSPDELDHHLTTIQLLSDEIGRAGLGRLELSIPGSGLTTDRIEVGCHHLGTTRMADDPSQGVVDPDGRCWDVDNLYVAGSAVFPTGGYANPTLTLVALAHRLAAHLRRELTGRAG
jgi:choline dehydrogenase-like flavoprotein